MQRQLKILKTKSFFLFGPRGVGKSTLLHSLFPAKNTYTFDLLDFDLTSRLTHKPSEFSEILHSLPAHIEWVIIDEIQKISSLLDEVHRSIFKNKTYVSL
ncbi:MAG: AAA family ATPase [Deltaproteobacteria bacterium]|nr:MAG: AAA family ATPase [Deltaproteobacteria bacterium]